MIQGLPWEAVSRVMDPRLIDLFTAWQGADASTDPLTIFAAHRDHLLVLDVDQQHSRYRHYGAAFIGNFGVDLTGKVIDMLPSAILPEDQRGMMEFEYAYAHRHHSALWRSYTAVFGDRVQTWQRLVLPLGEEALAVGAYAGDPPQGGPLDDPACQSDALLRLVIGRLPVVLDQSGRLSDLALTLKAYSDSRAHLAELEHQATSDPLTGVANLRQYLHLSRLELDHAMLMGRPLAVLGLDIDHFKSINDSYGHGVGDEALKLFVQTCREGVRELDIVGRCGGEEFGITLPNTTVMGAQILAERLRTLIEQCSLPLANGESLSFTVSIGIAVYSGDWKDGEMTIDSLRDQADTALYQAKRGGRNRVVVATGDER